MEVINKGGTDKTVIMAIRQGIVQPFTATDWLDLRIGFLLSITDDTVDDPSSPITGLTETITGSPFLGFYDRYYIGVISTDGQVVIAYTNRANQSTPLTRGNSV